MDTLHAFPLGILRVESLYLLRSLDYMLCLSIESSVEVEWLESAREL